jgi:hypothetical protein
MATQNYNPAFDNYSESLQDFAKPIMSHLRSLIHSTCPDVTFCVFSQPIQNTAPSHSTKMR